MAIEGGRVQCVKELLSVPGIDVNIKDIDGNTAVMLARGKYEIQKLLRAFCEFPVHIFSKVILCGNSGAEKSTLAQVYPKGMYMCEFVSILCMTDCANNSCLLHVCKYIQHH